MFSVASGARKGVDFAEVCGFCPPDLAIGILFRLCDDKQSNPIAARLHDWAALVEPSRR
jgi:hypothetical protein